jgi:hypothetical protein
MVLTLLHIMNKEELNKQRQRMNRCFWRYLA